MTDLDVDVLRGLDTGGHLALSLYLDVSTLERRRRVMQRVTTAIEAKLAAGDGHTAEQAEELQEDLEMVRLYFGTSASRRSQYVAIFSCAAQLFWRVVPLRGPVDETIGAAESLDLRPLREALSATEPNGSRRNDLLPHFTCASV